MINANTFNADGEITEILILEKEKEKEKEFYTKDELEENAKVFLNSLYGKDKWKTGKEVKTVTKIGVTVISTNDKRYEHNYIETDTLLSASRIMNTFKPKRGYRAISFKVEEVEVLV